MLTRHISHNIRRLAAARALALAHLADRAGVGRTTLWRLLDVNDTGPSDPRLSTLEALAATLGVPVVDLFQPPLEDTPEYTR